MIHKIQISEFPANTWACDLSLSDLELHVLNMKSC